MKLRSIFLLTAFLFIFLHLSAQQTIVMPNGDTVFFQPPSLADSLLNIGDVNASIVEYRKEYLHDPKTCCYNFACAFSLNRQVDSAFKYLYQAIKFDTNILTLTDPDFLPLRNDKRWAEFENKVIAEIFISHPHDIIDLPLAEKLWEMMALDQEFYYEIDIVESKIGMNSPVEKALWDEKEKINKKNEWEIDSIFNVKGWPKISQVGHFGSSAAFLVVQHSSTEQQKKYLPVIKELCKIGEANWSDYALMYDRVQIADHKPQLFGSQLKYNDDTKQYELYPIEDEKNVDKRRSEMGLESLEDYLQQGWGIKYMPKK